MQNGKGSRNRTKDTNKYRENFDSINWKKESSKSAPIKMILKGNNPNERILAEFWDKP